MTAVLLLAVVGDRSLLQQVRKKKLKIFFQGWKFLLNEYLKPLRWLFLTQRIRPTAVAMLRDDNIKSSLSFTHTHGQHQ
jgi:hypothetical protein